MMLLVNAGPDEVRFELPTLEGRNDENGGRRGAAMWSEQINTAREDLWQLRDGWTGLAPYSLVLLRHGRERRTTMAGGATAANVAAVTSAGENSPTVTVTPEMAGQGASG
jgi:hypothetical protein